MNTAILGFLALIAFGFGAVYKGDILMFVLIGAILLSSAFIVHSIDSLHPKKQKDDEEGEWEQKIKEVSKNQ